MCQATLDLISPNGVPVTLHVTDADDQQTVLTTIDRAEKLGASYVSTITARHVSGAVTVDKWY